MRGQWTARDRGGLVLIRFEYIQTFEFLVQHGQWLESLCFFHLDLKPVLDLILCAIFQVLVKVVEMSVDMLMEGSKEI
jgi:hypothetical protein